MTIEKRRYLENLFYLVSLISVGVALVACILGTIGQSAANSRDILELKASEASHSKEFEEIRTRLTHIEDAVGADK